ncbi:MAG: DNA polymerase Y family protein [Rhodopila sp.]|nr:DNA polymerase Y family protein [Rhodopila sp.]
MRRVVSVWFPTLPTDRLGRPEGREGQGSSPNPLSHGSKGHGPWQGSGQRPDLASPVIIVASRVLTAVNEVAAGLGLRVGMKLAQAQALVPGLSVHDADPAGDAAALMRLAGWCLRYAPLAAADPPDGLWIDVSGSTHLHGGETRLLRDLVRRLTGQGLAACAAVADTPAVAHAVARFGGGGVVPPGGSVMADFPIEALRLPAEVLANLRLMGFERVGPLAAAARAPLVRRFGALLTLRLDQAAGKVFEPIVPVVPPELIQARLAFVEPLLTAEAFSTVIARLVALVCGDMERASLGARQLDLLFERVDGSVQAIRVGTARPVRDARHLGRMLDERLERVDPGLGVEAMRLVVAIADPLGFVQTSASLVETAIPDIAPLVDRLANRLGEARVYRIAPVESDVPERSVRRVPALATFAGGWPADLPRPVRLLDPPQPVEAMALLPDHPPVAFIWRRVRHRVRHADGPERIAGEWWKRDREMLSVRDYFRVEDEDGRRFWLFRRGDGSDVETGDMRWFLHGFF